MIPFVIHHPILLYAIQVVACSAIFWLFYKGVIEQGRHFALSRWFLLFTMVASAVIPLISIPIYTAAPLMTASITHQTAPIANMLLEADPQTKVSPIALFAVIYMATSSILIIRLGLQLLSLCRVYMSGSKRYDGDCLIVHSPKIETPFSFIRTIYLPQILETSEEKLFLLHERAHIRERHSLDILFYETLSIFYWFNPIFWLTGRELKKIHEYQADRAAVSSTQSARLYQTLIAKEFLGFSPKIGHAFNGSLTKKRIIMLTQPFKTKRIALRMALVIPITVLNLSLFSCTIKQQESEADMPATKANMQAQTLVFEVVEQKPSFQGGDENTFSSWVKEHTSYPPSAKEQGIQGRVMLSFIIDVDGSVQNVTVLRGVDPALDREAVRAVSSAPKWTPGRQDGQIVKVRYNFPVTFQLAGSSNTTKSTSTETSQLQQPATKAERGGSPFQLVEQKPTFQGGDENAFSTWVKNHIQYPPTAKENGIQGRVMLFFVVDTDGSVQDVIVLRGVDPALDKEAIRVVSSSPKWTPGRQDGQTVRVAYNFPVQFQL
jgi:TonB family protein